MFSKGVYQVLVANNHSLMSCVSKMKSSQCKADLPTEKQMSCMGEGDEGGCGRWAETLIFLGWKQAPENTLHMKFFRR